MPATAKYQKYQPPNRAPDDMTSSTLSLKSLKKKEKTENTDYLSDCVCLDFFEKNAYFCWYYYYTR